ncbi:MAG: bifunctional tRNA (5-methylaminomethyl-2-thiouridine)(34)-methyltransferase MnmD/FAD-dependent 5-carboxymethylaminomethyl-2-thiouridine(34) oxidoreductase MnmC [Oceanospirillaceae bacterium]|nr:bifunctional tRNA (5-methylaminomethyl-2-thiouridine)(34)-methyltransferase MnmD/FAD-dependent 5-carboxymethylaminomethyl-2-thiouridine(34) oxidoreductase MnmC [Oceanospirillaceae bacterium]MCP5351227.1 bifunctional tRNA (5-methylaminomethyl-2-thiouridine)(34)-methyltransferase MnmD/FAD-dependent 5-carboxymethylaminomethyl-2-thiouridine(34) oxidoreductase MnmC [Oceanospirillaceae bacterium]
MIQQAILDWSGDTPVSKLFDDIYYPPEDAVSETYQVFINPNRLPQRFAALCDEHFVIHETGFGSGLNFLCTWQLWRQTAPASARLHFCSVEKYPLSRNDLQQVLQHWPEFAELSAQLIQHYPLPLPGLQRVEFDHGRVVLHLFQGDVQDWLAECQHKADAWFLDGFAPVKNPEMWREDLYREIGRLSKPGTTASTFTAAGQVRRGLRGAGFQARRADNLTGKKWQRTEGTHISSQGPQLPPWRLHKPWFCLPQINKPKDAIVIGAGIAGCASAYALARRGINVTVLESAARIATGGSGNAQGVLYVKLPTQANSYSRFYTAGYRHSLQLINQLMADHPDWSACGVLQLAESAKEFKRQQDFMALGWPAEMVQMLDAKTASDIAGVEVSQPGLFYPEGGWLSPPSLCHQLLQHANIELRLNCTVEHLNYADGKWHLFNAAGECIAQTACLIIANAHQAKQFTQLQFLDIKPNAGQVSYHPLENPSPLKSVLCSKGYVAPAHNGQLVFGATYRLNNAEVDVRSAEHIENQQMLQQEFPGLTRHLNLNPDAFNGRAAVRCASRDYWPIAGPVCDPQAFNEDFKALQKNRAWRFSDPAQFLPGLYLNIAHGSRGLSSAPLCAELIAAQICQEPLPVENSVADMLSPNRFLVKNISNKRTD